MPIKHPNQDRSFDDLAKRFKRNIYNSPKGQLRLAVLKRDFQNIKTALNGKVLDVGCGQGQFAAWLGEQGAQLTLTDISPEMLELAQELFKSQASKIKQSPRFLHCNLQGLKNKIGDEQFDIVCNHAVLEWLQEPFQAIDHLTRYVKEGGWLSLLFYNVHGLVFKNLLRANYRKVIKQDTQGQRGSLTPINPLEPQDVLQKLIKSGFAIEEYSGVRVFHDYILNKDDQNKSPEEMQTLELELSQQEPYRGLGRYIHVLARLETRTK